MLASTLCHRIFLIPHGSSNVCVLNWHMNEEVFGTLSQSSRQYYNGIFVNDKIYCTPYDADNVGIIKEMPITANNIIVWYFVPIDNIMPSYGMIRIPISANSNAVNILPVSANESLLNPARFFTVTNYYPSFFHNVEPTKQVTNFASDAVLTPLFNSNGANRKELAILSIPKNQSSATYDYMGMYQFNDTPLGLRNISTQKIKYIPVALPEMGSATVVKQWHGTILDETVMYSIIYDGTKYTCHIRNLITFEESTRILKNTDGTNVNYNDVVYASVAPLKNDIITPILIRSSNSTMYMYATNYADNYSIVISGYGTQTPRHIPLIVLKNPDAPGYYTVIHFTSSTCYWWAFSRTTGVETRSIEVNLSEFDYIYGAFVNESKTNLYVVGTPITSDNSLSMTIFNLQKGVDYLSIDNSAQYKAIMKIALTGTSKDEIIHDMYYKENKLFIHTKSDGTYNHSNINSINLANLPQGMNTLIPTMEITNYYDNPSVPSGTDNMSLIYQNGYLMSRKYGKYSPLEGFDYQFFNSVGNSLGGEYNKTVPTNTMRHDRTLANDWLIVGNKIVFIGIKSVPIQSTRNTRIMVIQPMSSKLIAQYYTCTPNYPVSNMYYDNPSDLSSVSSLSSQDNFDLFYPPVVHILSNTHILLLNSVDRLEYVNTIDLAPGCAMAYVTLTNPGGVVYADGNERILLASTEDASTYLYYLRRYIQSGSYAGKKFFIVTYNTILCIEPIVTGNDVLMECYDIDLASYASTFPNYMVDTRIITTATNNYRIYLLSGCVDGTKWASKSYILNSPVSHQGSLTQEYTMIENTDGTTYDYTSGFFKIVNLTPTTFCTIYESGDYVIVVTTTMNECRHSSAQKIVTGSITNAFEYQGSLCFTIKGHVIRVNHLLDGAGCSIELEIIYSLRHHFNDQFDPDVDDLGPSVSRDNLLRLYDPKNKYVIDVTDLKNYNDFIIQANTMNCASFRSYEYVQLVHYMPDLPFVDTNMPYGQLFKPHLNLFIGIVLNSASDTYLQGVFTMTRTKRMYTIDESMYHHINYSTFIQNLIYFGNSRNTSQYLGPATMLSNAIGLNINPVDSTTYYKIESGGYLPIPASDDEQITLRPLPFLSNMPYRNIGSNLTITNIGNGIDYAYFVNPQYMYALPTKANSDAQMKPSWILFDDTITDDTDAYIVAIQNKGIYVFIKNKIYKFLYASGITQAYSTNKLIYTSSFGEVGIPLVVSDSNGNPIIKSISTRNASVGSYDVYTITPGSNPQTDSINHSTETYMAYSTYDYSVTTATGSKLYKLGDTLLNGKWMLGENVLYTHNSSTGISSLTLLCPIDRQNITTPKIDVLLGNTIGTEEFAHTDMYITQDGTLDLTAYIPSSGFDAVIPEVKTQFMLEDGNYRHIKVTQGIFVLYKQTYTSSNGAFEIDTTTINGLTTMPGKWHNPVKINDSKIYCLPKNSGTIGIIYTSTNSFYQLQGLNNIPFPSSGSLHIEGNTGYLVPEVGQYIYIIDIVNDLVLSSIDLGNIYNIKDIIIDGDIIIIIPSVPTDDILIIDLSVTPSTGYQMDGKWLSTFHLSHQDITRFPMMINSSINVIYNNNDNNVVQPQVLNEKTDSNLTSEVSRIQNIYPNGVQLIPDDADSKKIPDDLLVNVFTIMWKNKTRFPSNIQLTMKYLAPMIELWSWWLDKSSITFNDGKFGIGTKDEIRYIIEYANSISKDQLPASGKFLREWVNGAEPPIARFNLRDFVLSSNWSSNPMRHMLDVFKQACEYDSSFAYEYFNEYEDMTSVRRRIGYYDLYPGITTVTNRIISGTPLHTPCIPIYIPSQYNAEPVDIILYINGLYIDDVYKEFDTTSFRHVYYIPETVYYDQNISSVEIMSDQFRIIYVSSLKRLDDFIQDKILSYEIPNEYKNLALNALDFFVYNGNQEHPVCSHVCSNTMWFQNDDNKSKKLHTNRMVYKDNNHYFNTDSGPRMEFSYRGADRYLIGMFNDPTDINTAVDLPTRDTVRIELEKRLKKLMSIYIPITNSEITFTIPNLKHMPLDKFQVFINGRDIPLELCEVTPEYDNDNQTIAYHVTTNIILDNPMPLYAYDTIVNLTVFELPYRRPMMGAISRIPADGIVDLTKIVNTPMSLKWYDVYLNGRRLGERDCVVLSPTKICIFNNVSLKNLVIYRKDYVANTSPLCNAKDPYEFNDSNKWGHNNMYDYPYDYIQPSIFTDFNGDPIPYGVMHPMFNLKPNATYPVPDMTRQDVYQWICMNRAIFNPDTFPDEKYTGEIQYPRPWTRPDLNEPYGTVDPDERNPGKLEPSVYPPYVDPNDPTQGKRPIPDYPHPFHPGPYPPGWFDPDNPGELPYPGGNGGGIGSEVPGPSGEKDPNHDGNGGSGSGGGTGGGSNGHNPGTPPTGGGIDVELPAIPDTSLISFSLLTNLPSIEHNVMIGNTPLHNIAAQINTNTIDSSKFNPSSDANP